MLVGIVLVTYFGVGAYLSYRANRHLKDPDKTYLYNQLNNPSDYTDEGQRPLMIANRFWLVGGVIALWVFLRF